MKKTFWIAALLATAMPWTLQAGEETAAFAKIYDANKTEIGSLALKEATKGLIAEIDLHSIPKGWHAIHIHEHGDCEADDFKSAGGHAKGAAAHHHGIHSEHGMHAGDMPNIWAGEDGEVKVHYFLKGLTVASFLDEDGSALIVHEGSDDYESQPSGAAGARIACGVLKPLTD